MKVRERLQRNRYTIVTIIVMIVIYLAFTLQYETNDDPQIMNDISGLYSGEPSAMPFYMQVPYSLLIAGLYRITTQVSWYSIAFLIINAVSIVVISRVIVRDRDSIWKYLAFLGVVTALYLCNLVNVQYTTVSGLTGATATLLVFSIDSHGSIKDIKWQVIGAAIFTYLGYNIRNQSISVLSVVILYILIGNKIIRNNSIKNQLIAVLVCLLVIALSYGCNTLYSNTTEWNEYAELQTARGGYMDYNRLPYEGNEDVYAAVGWDESATEIIRNWCFRLEEANTEDFATLNELIRTDVVKERTIALGGNLITFIASQRREAAFIGLEAVWILLLWIRAFLRRDERWIRNCIYITGLWLLQVMFICYLVWGGRYKERAIYMTFFICSTPVLKELLDAMFDQREELSIWNYMPVLLLMIMTYMGYMRTSSRNILSYEAIDEAEEYVLAHKENIYMGDTGVGYRQRMFRSFDQASTLTNLFWWGIWLEGSGFDHDQLRINGFEQLDLQDMLQDGHYFISTGSDAMELLDAYYEARYEGVICEIVYQTDNIIVYSYSLAE